jgi:hypothetical protein
MMRPLHQLRDTLLSGDHIHCSKDGLEYTSDGCENCISEWVHKGGGVY